LFVHQPSLDCLKFLATITTTVGRKRRRAIGIGGTAP